MAATLHHKNNGSQTPCEKIRAALDRYKAKPLAPDSLEHIRTCFREMEKIQGAEKLIPCENLVLETLKSTPPPSAFWKPFGIIREFDKLSPFFTQKLLRLCVEYLKTTMEKLEAHLEGKPQAQYQEFRTELENCKYRYKHFLRNVERHQHRLNALETRLESSPLVPKALKICESPETRESPIQKPDAIEETKKPTNPTPDKNFFKKIVQKIYWFGRELFDVLYKATVSVMVAGVIFGAVMVLGTEIKNCMNRKPPKEQQKVQITKEETKGKFPSLQRITPNNPLVLKAIAKGTRKGSLSISQILDAYDFVVSHIEYRNIPNVPGGYPRWPRETLAPIFQNCQSGLCKSVADCKSMTVVLASILEGIGAETCMVQAKKHLYLTVWMYQGTKAKLDAAEKKITRIIMWRYGRAGKPLRFFRSEDGKHLFLALDPTMGRVPGIVNPAKIFGFYNSRPSFGNIPDLK